MKKITSSPIDISNIISINFTALFFGAVLSSCLFKIDPDRVWLNLLISLLGGLIGWVLGNFASPVNSNEQKTFSELAKVVATFFSGYVVSKLDRFLEGTLFSNNQIDETSWISACFFLSALILASVTVFLNRTYALKPKSKPALADILNSTGTLYLQRAEYSNALESFEKALMIRPNVSQFWNNKGLALEKLNKHDEAIKAFEQAVKLKPTFEDAQKNLTRLNGRES